MLKDADFSAVPDGEKAVTDGDVFMNVYRYQSKPYEQKKPETHLKYIDIQYVIEGEEVIACRPLEDAETPVESIPEKDLYFQRDGTLEPIRVSAGSFVIIFPHEVHAPSLALDVPRDIRKAVVKVPVG